MLNYSTYCLQWDRQLLLSCDSWLLLSRARGFSQGHVVDFQFPDNELKLMAMRSSNTLMLTYGNRGRTDMAGTVQAGTAVLSSALNRHIVVGHADAHMSEESNRLKVVVVLARRLQVSEEQLMFSLQP